MPYKTNYRQGRVWLRGGQNKRKGVASKNERKLAEKYGRFSWNVCISHAHAQEEWERGQEERE